jgi:hypothetical protein
MGQGQEESARKMITEAILNGHWLMLQNCHLSLEFCDEIMQTMLDTDEMHPNFRPGFFLQKNILKEREYYCEFFDSSFYLCIYFCVCEICFRAEFFFLQN